VRFRNGRQRRLENLAIQYRLRVCLTRFERRPLVLALLSAAAFVLYKRLNHLPLVTYEPAFQPPFTFFTGISTAPIY